jgi:RNA polymerase sigma-70 factor, ECF subfamily
VQIDEERLFDTCFRGYAGHVHAFVLRRADAELAQEATSETFLIAWRRRAEMPDQPLPWLYGIARGVLANERRASNRRSALQARIAAQPFAAGGDGPEDHLVLEALASLADADREALLLLAWEGLSIREAAIVLGCSETAFAVRAHRARRRLMRQLGGCGTSSEPTPSSKSLPEAST